MVRTKGPRTLVAESLRTMRDQIKWVRGRWDDRTTTSVWDPVTRRMRAKTTDELPENDAVAWRHLAVTMDRLAALATTVAGYARRRADELTS